MLLSEVWGLKASHLKQDAQVTNFDLVYALQPTRKNAALDLILTNEATQLANMVDCYDQDHKLLTVSRKPHPHQVEFLTGECYNTFIPVAAIKDAYNCKQGV